MDLDPVDPVLDLLADLFDDLVPVVHDDGVAGPPLVGDHPSGGPPDRGHQGVATGGHPRALDEPGIDSIAELDADHPQAVGVEDARDAGPQHLLGVVGRQH